jgi:two-component system cell cycle response regulator DivK
MPKRILIADDYEDNRELLRLLLSTAKYQVLEAANGRDCLRIAIDEQPDLILIDLSMPVLDGWGVFGELRANDRTARIPCVAVTAHAESDRNKALEHGFSGYLTKPFRTSELLETVRQLLDKKNSQPVGVSEGRKIKVT